ncbi:MAG: DUF2117 domain-containing protein [Candidatus Nezhaarchaeales archaeon]|nr:MAG: hypothetical protein DRJ60_05985 [Thermoprotei archaeon]
MAEIFDRGQAREIVEALSSLGHVDCRIRGVTGYTAALDSGLNEIVKLEKAPVSMLIAQANHDAIVLASCTQNPEKFHAYCWLVSRHVRDKPIIEVEMSSKTVTPLNDKAQNLAHEISNLLGLRISERKEFPSNIWSDGKRTYRRILAAEPGDFVLVNGIIVGKITSNNEAILIEENGKLVDAIGITLKLHGVEKLNRLGFRGLENSKVSSIKILRRRTESRAKIECGEGRGVAILDHEVTDVHDKATKVEGAITIGDDTTLIVSDIFERYGKRVLGIMDGDADGLLEFSKLPSNSMLLVVEKDDEAGMIIRKELFKDKDYLDLSFDDVIEKVVEMLKPKIKMVIRLR